MTPYKSNGLKRSRLAERGVKVRSVTLSRASINGTPRSPVVYVEGATPDGKREVPVERSRRLGRNRKAKKYALKRPSRSP